MVKRPNFKEVKIMGVDKVLLPYLDLVTLKLLPSGKIFAQFRIFLFLTFILKKNRQGRYILFLSVTF